MDSKESKDIEQFVLDRYEPITGSDIAIIFIPILLFALFSIFMGSIMEILEITLIAWAVIIVALLRYTYLFEKGKRSIKAHIMYRGIADTAVILSTLVFVLHIQFASGDTHALIIVIAFVILASVINIRMVKYKNFYLDDKIAHWRNGLFNRSVYGGGGGRIHQRGPAGIVARTILYVMFAIICALYALGASKSFHMLYLLRKHCPHIADNFGGEIKISGKDGTRRKKADKGKLRRRQYSGAWL